MTARPNGSTPLGPIALSLSGGGGRAAGFHLGTLAYLDRLDLLRDVSILSTVSGGSFVGASYLLALKEAPAGEDPQATFARYLPEFRSTLLTSRLLPWALQRLAGGGIDVPSGRHTLVVALAQVYDDTFLHHARFGMLWDGRDIHVKDVIFNATEFRTGGAFRFQKSDHPCVIGNEHVRIGVDDARAMRLADVVACSSCIPVGLEPLMFPDDFGWPDGSQQRLAAIKAELKRQCGADTVPIMDGGVYDNQGIESAMLAMRRHSPREGTYIVSDTPLMADEGFQAESPVRATSALTLSRLDMLTHLLSAASLLTIAYLIGHLLLSRNQLNVFTEVDDFFTYLIPIALSVMLGVTLMVVRHRVRQMLAAFPQMGERSWHDLRHLTLPQLADMLKLRVGSTWALTSWVYFNRIRHLGYDLLRTLPAERRRVIRHEIADLLHGAQPGTLPAWLAPSPKAAALAKHAASLPTQLWYDSEADLDAAINCGRMTMCFNLLVHFQRQPGERTADQQRLYDLAKADWALLQENPGAALPRPTRAAA